VAGEFVDGGAVAVPCSGSISAKRGGMRPRKRSGRGRLEVAVGGDRRRRRHQLEATMPARKQVNSVRVRSGDMAGDPVPPPPTPYESPSLRRKAVQEFARRTRIGKDLPPEGVRWNTMGKRRWGNPINPTRLSIW
jgi:hypothetical protein